MNIPTPPGGATLAGLATEEARVWENSPYYDQAEKWTWLFWSRDHWFLPLFEQLDLTHTLELACGHGRHAERLLSAYGPKVEKLYLTDILPSNIDHCRTRIGPAGKVSLFVNKGIDFQPVASESISAIYCYDAMVHFDRDVVRAYLDDALRVLVPGGKALFHHSNYAARSDTPFSQNPGARAYMSAELFREYTEAARLTVLAQSVLEWGGVDKLDAVSLVKKPPA